MNVGQTLPCTAIQRSVSAGSETGPRAPILHNVIRRPNAPPFKPVVISHSAIRPAEVRAKMPVTARANGSAIRPTMSVLNAMAMAAAMQTNATHAPTAVSVSKAHL